jgi:hypothetical protein
MTVVLKPGAPVPAPEIVDREPVTRTTTQMRARLQLAVPRDNFDQVAGLGFKSVRFNVGPMPGANAAWNTIAAPWAGTELRQGVLHDLYKTPDQMLLGEGEEYASEIRNDASGDEFALQPWEDNYTVPLP